MNFSVSDWIGSIGVMLLLVAFLLNLNGKISKDSYAYIIMNIIGAGLSCLASYLINYIPFIILEAAWTLVSFIALVRKSYFH